MEYGEMGAIIGRIEHKSFDPVSWSSTFATEERESIAAAQMTREGE